MNEASATRRLVTVAEAAEYAGLHEQTIRRYLRDHTITGYRYGPRAVRVDLDELDRELLRPMGGEVRADAA